MFRSKSYKSIVEKSYKVHLKPQGLNIRGNMHLKQIWMCLEHLLMWLAPSLCMNIDNGLHLFVKEENNTYHIHMGATDQSSKRTKPRGAMDIC